MKAIVYTKVGGPEVLQVREVPKPQAKKNQVLIRVKACALNVADYQPFEGKIGLGTHAMNLLLGRKGKPIGAEIAGIVEEVGPEISHIQVGDRVFGKVAGTMPIGGLAEYALMDKERVEAMPTGLSFSEAASLSISFETALGSLKKAAIKPGDEVLIYGASGGVGSFAIQIAKARGARVTGVCSTRNVTQAYQLGCSLVIDYKKEDFRQVGHTFDAIIGINGCNPMKDYKKLLKPDGIFVGIGNAKQASLALAKSFTSRQFTYLAGLVSPQKGYLTYAKELVEQGQLRPMIDKVYKTSQVQEVIRYCLEEHPQGKVVVAVDF